MTTLTYHKKSVRAMALHPKEYNIANLKSNFFVFASNVIALQFLYFLSLAPFLGTVLHLPQLTTSRNLTFPEGSFCTICCEFSIKHPMPYNLKKYLEFYLVNIIYSDKVIRITIKSKN